MPSYLKWQQCHNCINDNIASVSAFVRGFSLRASDVSTVSSMEWRFKYWCGLSNVGSDLIQNERVIRLSCIRIHWNWKCGMVWGQIWSDVYFICQKVSFLCECLLYCIFWFSHTFLLWFLFFHFLSRFHIAFISI